MYRTDGRVFGSAARVQFSTAKQAVAIERALSHVRAFDRVGAILWMAGYDVDECYWRPALRKADDVASLVGRWGQRLSQSHLSGRTFGERFAQTQKLNGILHTVARKARRPDFARVIDMAVEVAAGEFSGFRLPSSDRDESEQALAERAFGFEVGADHHVHGKRLKLEIDLPAILEAMSVPMSLDDFTDHEIAMARDDARNAFKVAHCLYASAEWIYGRGAFGLHLTTSVVRSFSLALVQALAVGFARLRRQSDTLLSGAEIADLAVEAERLWMMSMWLKDIAEGDGENAGTLSAKRLKSALTDSASHQKLLGELASYEFARSEFRPWDQWRKSAGKTMSPGLLVMSIGSPKVIAFDDLVGSTNGPANL